MSLRKAYKQFEEIKRQSGFPRLSYSEFHLTDRCNLACYFCNQASLRKRGASELSYDLIRDTLSQMKQLGLKEVRLSGGGEPTCHPEFPHILEYLVEHDIGVANLTTNGLLCNKELVDLLMSTDWMSVLFSLQACEKKAWEGITGGKKRDYGKVLDNIRYLVERKRSLGCNYPEIGVLFGIDSQTYASIHQAYELACELGVDAMLVCTYNNIVYPREVVDASEGIVQQVSEIYLENEKTRKLKGVYFALHDLGLNTELMERVSPVTTTVDDACITDPYEPCFMPWHGTMIQANGDVVICCNGWMAYKRLGNITEESISSIWRGKNYRALRKKFKDVLFDYLCGKGVKALHGLQINCVPHQDFENGCPIKIRWHEFIKAYQIKSNRAMHSAALAQT